MPLPKPPEPVPGAGAATPSGRDGLDQSDLACVLAHALALRDRGQGSLPECLGLPPADLARLAARWFPGLDLPDLDLPFADPPEEQKQLALLLTWRGGAASEEARWFARILARRAMEGNHLWEDLGLPSRAALGALMQRHFPRLHAANTKNMRWKKFFYRQICADTGFSLCLAPSCGECAEYSACFAPE